MIKALLDKLLIAQCKLSCIENLCPRCGLDELLDMLNDIEKDLTLLSTNQNSIEAKQEENE